MRLVSLCAISQEKCGLKPSLFLGPVVHVLKDVAIPMRQRSMKEIAPSFSSGYHNNQKEHGLRPQILVPLQKRNLVVWATAFPKRQ